MQENNNLDNIVIEKGKIKKACFEYKNKFYEAIITAHNISITKPESGYAEYICDFDRETKEIQWYYQHCCGLQGFGLHWSDMCPSCETKGGTTKDPTESWLGFESKNINFPELIDILNEYCTKLEDTLKSTLLSFPKVITRLDQIKLKLQTDTQTKYRRR
ncbi:MAG: hypothetical protein KKF46_08640 [Nanoarchaeota archaeon]|nr:hypothetical protein [Nanoarchaeota archaeon]MBU1322397.1 hypothetical protein [Nanoarchaeota archaeon]MBU1596928.1 hypothetical protein [Nanoarchaeota archaeon]MBU2442355.1 hypothetical protein [Nanoarchaeota archaeon]